MNAPQSRREFLADVGKGTLLATLGPALAAEFGISTAVAEEAPAAGVLANARTFGGEDHVHTLMALGPAEARELLGVRC